MEVRVTDTSKGRRKGRGKLTSLDAAVVTGATPLRTYGTASVRAVRAQPIAPWGGAGLDREERVSGETLLPCHVSIGGDLAIASHALFL